MGSHPGCKSACRTVSLYWCEKLWLVLDGLQLLAVLLSAMQSSLPYGWNAWARLTSVFLLDVTGLLRPLPTTNELGPYPLDALGRSFVLLFVLLLMLVAAAAWPRAEYAQELYERQKEIEKIKKEAELQRMRRPSQARPSVTAMLAISLRPNPPTFISRCRKVAHSLWAHTVVLLHYLLGKALKVRAGLALFFLPAVLAIELPLIFCSDQADACSSTGLLLVRIASLAVLIGLLTHCLLVLLRDAREATVARQGRQQEEYLKQKELEYMLYISNHWMEKRIWLVSSFKGGMFCSYFRLWLFSLKAALIFSSSLLGQALTRPPTGLGWLVSLGSDRDAALAAAAASGTLGDAIAAEPLGEAARTAAAAALVLLFCLFAIMFPPFRCLSTNCIHLLLFVHLGGVSGIGLAATATDAKRNSFLLYSNQQLLLAVVHLCSLCLLLATCACCFLGCLMPTESPLLQRYETMMGCEGHRSSHRAADGRGTVLALVHNIWLLFRLWWSRCVYWCGGRSGLNRYNSWSSNSSGSTLEIGGIEIQEDAFNLRPFEAPWPTRPQHARFWIRVAPRLVEQLAASSLLLQRYAAAEKQLLPVHLTNAAFRELEALVVQHIGAVEQRDTRRMSSRRSRKKTLEEEQRALEQLLRELGAGSPAALALGKERSEKCSRWEDSKASDLGGTSRDEESPDEGFVFQQHIQQTDDTIWAADSADTASSPTAMPHSLAFRQLERAAHLSMEFANANLKELQSLKSMIKAVECTVAEVFEKMAGRVVHNTGESDLHFLYTGHLVN